MFADLHCRRSSRNSFWGTKSRTANLNKRDCRSPTIPPRLRKLERYCRWRRAESTLDDMYGRSCNRDVSHGGVGFVEGADAQVLWVDASRIEQANVLALCDSWT